jgi:hypothetical protein
MEKEFVTYEIALKLKELGFDETCFCQYSKNEFIDITGRYKNSHFNKEDQIAAPLWQQAIEWFRKRNLIIDLSMVENGSDNWRYAVNQKWEYFRGSYEKDREQAILRSIDLWNIFGSR